MKFRNREIPFVPKKSNVFANIIDDPNDPTTRSRIVPTDNQPQDDEVNYGYGRVFDNEQSNQPMPQNGGTAEVEEPKYVNIGGETNREPIFTNSVNQPFPQNGGTAFSNIVEPDEPVSNTTPQNNPIDEEIERTKRLLYDKNYRNDPENKPNRWWSGAALAMKNMGDALMSGRSWGEAVGAGIGGFGGGALFPKALADLKHSQRLELLYKQQNEQRKEEDRQIVNAQRKAQINELKRRPEKEQADREAKANLEAQKQKQRLELIQARDTVNDANFKSLIYEDGKIFKLFKDGRREAVINPETGLQEVVSLKTPTELDVPDGYNDDGTPRTKKVYMTGGQYANLKSNEAARDAAMGVNTSKFNISNLTDYNNKFGELSGKINGANTKISSLQQRLTQLRNATGLEKFQAMEEIPKIEKDLMEAQAEKLQFETQLKNLKKPQNVSYGGGYSGKVYPSPAALRQAFPDKTDDQIKEFVEANGGRFKQ